MVRAYDPTQMNDRPLGLSQSVSQVQRLPNVSHAPHAHARD